MAVVDLRKAICWALTQETAVTTEEIAGIASCETATAFRELRRLGHLGVALETTTGWLPGKTFFTYKVQTVTTKQGGGGNSKAYRAAKEVRDRVRQRSWNEKRAGVTLGDQKEPEQPRTTASIIERFRLKYGSAPLLTTHQVCSMLLITPQTLNRYARLGLLLPIRIGTMTKRFRAEDLAAFIDQRRGVKA